MLINGQTTPGRRQFTLAHELGHALFHRGSVEVSFPGRREANERFADEFAGEFPVPADSLQTTVEHLRLERVADPETVIHLQRYFNVSYEMILNRLRFAGLMSNKEFEQCRSVHPSTWPSSWDAGLTLMNGCRTRNDGAWDDTQDGFFVFSDERFRRNS